MRVLPDTNIFIDYWEDRNGIADELENIFTEEEIVVCGAVKAELLHGAVSDKHLKSMEAMLDAFEAINPEEEDWQLLGENLYKLRTHGVTVPLADAIIATVAVRNRIAVWTNDHHFKLMQGVLSDLEIRS
ncbi:MAG: PIN domain-containing protein [Lachnospiraceae bacterium]|nr:PIN domain-containing protein [Lachnospiraceae bacterium]